MKTYKLKNVYIDSTGIMHKKRLLSDILDTAGITAYLVTDTTFANNSEYDIEVKRLHTKVGNGFEITDEGNIKCKRAGIVRISAQETIKNKQGGNAIPRIRINNSCIAEISTRAYSNHVNNAYTFANKLIVVNAEDIIKLRIGNWTGEDLIVSGGLEKTYITVEYIN